jgi:hypothetical protein
MIAMTDFAAGRHFDPTFAGTKIGSHTPEAFTEALNTRVDGVVEAPGYAPFCKHLFVRNFTDAVSGVVRITDENRAKLKVGYKARRPEELPVLESWFDAADVERGEAGWLDLVLYSRAQLAEEGIELPEGAEWGIVAILSATSPEEAPMKPITMMRNALGKEHGGSGAPLDPEAYERAVAYWSEWATVL